MAYLTLLMLNILPQYLAAHLFFHMFQQMNIRVACMRNLWAAFFCLAVHRCCSSTCREKWSGSIPAVAAKLLKTWASRFPELKTCSMQFFPDLSKQQTQFDGSMPKLVSLQFVGNLDLRAIYNKKEDLNAMFLCNKREFKLFLALFS